MQREKRNRRAVRIFSVLLVIVLAVVLSSSLKFRAQQSSAPTTMKDFEKQNLVWEGCYSGFQCAKLLVPIDYKDMSVGTFTLQLLKFAARKQAEKIGALVINPGGPGASGVNYAYNAEYVFSPEILDKYDIVGFDPRGVGFSSPIHCLSNKELDGSYAADSNPDTSKELQTLVSEMRSYVAKCEASSKDILHYGTADSARDMDLIRRALGEAKLNYLGASYGTYLGTLYASYFPDKVGRMVLDGAIDPSASTTEQNLTQAIGFDTALRSFIDDCYRYSDCPLERPQSKAISQIIALFAKSAKQPLSSSSNREVTETLLVLGTASALYDSTDGWPKLRAAIRESQSGVGDKFLSLSDEYTQRTRGGKYESNEADAAFVIDCLDSSEKSSTEKIRAAAPTFSAKAPVFGPYLAYAGLSCQFFSQSPGAPTSVTAIDTSPILIIGTTRDPATPYQWAVALHKKVRNSRLVSLDGDGHTGYGRGSACVDRAVDGYFLSGKLPKKDLFCTAP